MKKNIEISLEKAKQIYPNADPDIKKLLEEAFGKKLLITISCWEELEHIDGYYIDTYSQINFYSSVKNIQSSERNVFKKYSQAQSALAYAQLSQLLHEFNSGWTPDYKGGKTTFCIHFYYGTNDHASIANLIVVPTFSCKEFLVFRSNHEAEKFIALHGELIIQFFEGF